MEIDELRALTHRMLEQVERQVVGKREVLELLAVALLADGHVLIEDYPGLAKTLIARCFAQVADLRFTRIQFTPDLLPSDVTGSSLYDQRTGEFVFRPGPVFTNLLLADEVNRAPAKTQAALLEAMQEGRVTSEGETRSLDPPFLVLATQNPIEFEGTYPLPEAQLDRFLIRISIGYPSRDDEREILLRRSAQRADEIELERVVSREQLREMQAALEDVHVSEAVAGYIVDLVEGTRTSPRVQVGASPRGGLALLKLARARAAVQGRDFVTPEDIKHVAVAGLGHRLVLRPELWVQRFRPEDAVREVLDSVPTPPPQEAPAADVRSPGS